MYTFLVLGWPPLPSELPQFFCYPAPFIQQGAGNIPLRFLVALLKCSSAQRLEHVAL